MAGSSVYVLVWVKIYEKQGGLIVVCRFKKYRVLDQYCGSEKTVPQLDGAWEEGVLVR
jgi:hypothetical protein